MGQPKPDNNHEDKLLDLLRHILRTVEIGIVNPKTNDQHPGVYTCFVKTICMVCSEEEC
jgi:hypothetical protein